MAILFYLIIPSYAETDIPLNSRIYPVLNDLRYGGYITGHLSGSKPITTNEARRLLGEARERLTYDDDSGDGSRTYLRRSVEAVDREISLGTGDEWFQFKPLVAPEIKYIYLEGENSSISDTNASQHSLVYNNDGVDPGEGSNSYLSLSVEGKAGPISFSLTPLVSVNESTTAIIQKGYIKFHAWGLDLEAGKIPLWWGQGYHGSLFLSNNAEPLPMVRLTNPSPVLLPWFFKYLGPLRLDVFVSKLEEERSVPQPYFAGMRVNFRPHPVVEIGLTRTIQAFGDGRPDLTFRSALDALFGANKTPVSRDLSDSIGGIDMRLTLPFAELYGELGGEDQRGFLPSYPVAYIIGAYVPLMNQGMDFRVEYADIRSASWYTHGVYKSGYTYKGRILGHHVGRGGRELFAEAGFFKGKRLNGRVNFDYENRGVETQPIKEQHYQFGTDWEYMIGRALVNWRMNADLAYERITNFNNIPGDERSNTLISLSITAGI